MAGQEKAERLVKAAPELTEEGWDAMNGIFPAYIFRIRAKREVWTTCCRKHLIVSDEAGKVILDAPHTPAPRTVLGSWGCREIVRPKPIACPFCGRDAEVKELGRTGERKNLSAYRRAVVLRQWKGALWALAYDCAKHYGGEDLCRRPFYKLIGVYRFRPGQAEGSSRPWWGDCAWTNYYMQTSVPKGKIKWTIHDPYSRNAEEGTGYSVLCMDELEKSPFRWCCGAEFEKQSTDFIEFLTACCFFPRQIEMLMKLGMAGPVKDLVGRGIRNASAFKWEETDPRLSFGLDKAELKRFLDTDRNLDVLVSYKRLKKSGIPASFEQICMLQKSCGPRELERVTARLRKHRLTVERLWNYLERERQSLSEPKKQTYMTTMVTMWLDYTAAAEVLKLDLDNPVILTPRGLKEKHDDTTATAARLKQVTDSTEYRRKFLRKLAKRYTFSTEHYLIRPPVSAEEITAEGKALHHCVGGYAARHVERKTTILFLRDKKNPGKPFVTIEMNGNSIKQIHGEHNDIYSHIDQRKAQAEILDPWLRWLAEGSKRKNGCPVVPKPKKEVKTA